MPSASSCSAARTTSSTLRLWPRWTTSAPCAWMSRRMMLIAASWPSNRLAAVTKRRGTPGSGEIVGSLADRLRGVELMARSREIRQFVIVARGVEAGRRARPRLDSLAPSAVVVSLLR